MEENTDITEKTGFLKNTEIFARTNLKTLGEIASVLIPMKFKRNQMIIKKGAPGKAMFIIVSGKVRVHDGTHVLSRLEKGQNFGEYSLFDEEKRSASVTAEQETLLYKLEQDEFFELIAKDIEITKGILRVLIRQMRDRNILEEKLSKSYIRNQKQKEEIEAQHENILEQKKLLEQQNYDLVSLNEEKNNLLSIVVHGLKNPLTSSLCLAEMMKNNKGKPDQDHSEYSEIICKSLHRMNNMINQMLNINKIDSKKFKLELERINLARIVREVINNFRIISKQKNIEFSLKLKNAYSKLNRVYLIQIIDNLISNAVKFSPENSRIEIKLSETNTKVRLEIQDSGPGIDSAEKDNIFSKYKRQTSKILDPEHTKGLGLAIAKKYVDAMNGRIWFESETGKGSTFCIEFERMIEDPNQE